MISIKNVEKSYNGERVLNSVSLDIADGEFVSIMGESGSGKSTLLSILGGFLPSDGGQVLWNGEDISTFDDRRMASERCHNLGFVFQSFNLIPTLSVRDNILLVPSLGGTLSPDMVDYMNELSRELEIDRLMDKYPDKLSGGQRQRVAIIRALVYKPSTVILDEPTGALDSRMEGRVMTLLSRINKELGTTVIQVTHSRRVAECAERIITIEDGRIVL